MATTIYTKEWEIDTGTEGVSVDFDLLPDGGWRVHETNYGAVSEYVYGSWDNERWIDVAAGETERLLPLLFEKLWNDSGLSYGSFKQFLEKHVIGFHEGHWM